jgi:Amt family ammonium transporter
MIDRRLDNLGTVLDNVWILICSVMVFLAQVGFLMKETGSIRMLRNTAVLLKTILVICTSSLTFFVVGFGFSTEANGGILGEERFIGIGYSYSDYTKFIYYLSLCVMMSAIATGSIAERTHTDTYIFFSFVTSGFIFPIGLAWCWNDGWLSNIGFLDYGGASIVHLMGGMAGFIGTYLIGPRIGLYSADTKMAYVLDDEILGDDEACFAMEDYINKKNY